MFHPHNKKAVSEIISYVLLIVIAIAIAGMVFAYLKVYVPKQKPECKENIYLSALDFSCDGELLNLTLVNKGYFTVDGVYIRVGEQGSKIRWPAVLVRNNNEAAPLYFANYFGVYSKQNKALAPDETFSEVFNISRGTSGPGEYVLEIEPAVFGEKGLAVCEKALVTYSLSCN